ncbi:MAG: type II toxin-antitoxin system Phd/YefM family antitoxin [Desulfobulbaceae bacterium]|nr:type II toxin-antitoxin system Phd/YefM family antitoxin [Desulfobulbaceae bacterium]MCK5545593.1 type II toxin-antitoxin system Phd/YefM family antitoxin [Desulfobulbaceae bacterium]
MQTIQDYVPITQAKNKLLDMVRAIHDSDKAIAITKNGVPKAILISIEKFEGLLETIEILADDDARAQIKQSREDVKQGRLVDMKEVF